MDTILILIGVGCIIGAIIGGGVKLVQIELSQVTSLWRQSLLAVFGAILVLSGMIAGGHVPLLNSPASPAGPPGQMPVAKAETPEGQSLPPRKDSPSTGRAPQKPSRPTGQPVVTDNPPSSATAQDEGSPARPCSLEGSLRASSSDSPKPIRFINRTNSPVKTYWLGHDGARALYGTIPPGMMQSQGSFDAHPWLVTAADGSCLGIWMAGDTAVLTP